MTLLVPRDSTLGRAGDGALALSQVSRGSVRRAGAAPLSLSVSAGEDSLDARVFLLTMTSCIVGVLSMSQVWIVHRLFCVCVI